MENGRREHKLLLALYGLQELFCLLLSGAFPFAHAQSRPLEWLTPGSSSRAFPVLLQRDGLWPIVNSKGGKLPSLPASVWNSLQSSLYNRAEAILFLNHISAYLLPL